MKYYAGIDLGGTFVKMGIVDETGKILLKGKIPTGKDRPYMEIATDMANFVKDLSKQAGVEVEAVGIGAPGTIDSANGNIVYSNNIAWKNVPLAKALQDILGKKVSITNDANAAALGESFCGAGKKYKNSIFLTLGTGLGGGIIIDGKLYEGGKSAGAELGHTVIRVGGAQCTCGRKGCYEAYASATALIRMTKEELAKDKEKTSAIWAMVNNDLEAIDGKTVEDAVRDGDKLAKRVWKKYANYLTEGMLNFANIFRPEVILLGGGISHAGDLLLSPVKRKFKKECYGGSDYAPVKVGIASLGNDAGLCGAVKFAIDSLNK